MAHISFYGHQLTLRCKSCRPRLSLNLTSYIGPIMFAVVTSGLLDA